jgi:hypothetical protein
LLRDYERRHVRSGYTHLQPWIMLRALGDAQLALHCVQHDPRRYLRVVARAISTLRKRRAPYAQFGCSLLRASLCQLRGDDARAAELYAVAASQAETQGLHDAAICARVRHAQLLGAPVPAVATAWFEHNRVRNPSAWVRMTCPVEPGIRLRSGVTAPLGAGRAGS